MALKTPAPGETWTGQQVNDYIALCDSTVRTRFESMQAQWGVIIPKSPDPKAEEALRSVQLNLFKESI